ncbi:CS1 type fimbrial major subunit [Symbiopectobacterium purcellii]|uniref:CS1 type fimbrial major subunit n=1 Tax=Symbiopectobacterium purcellii TaxID=2871826 RepID=UPI0020768E65|nr:CS1 type fimbrial major subunit [Symbiopectobacterium purcellii]
MTRDITVTASIDPTVDITLSDGTALPDTIAMSYLPSHGLNSVSRSVKLWSNSATADLTIALATSSPSLSAPTTTTTIPLTVTLNGIELNTASSKLEFAEYFPNGITNGSITIPLVISQTTKGVVSTAGDYSGTVSLVLAQATSQGS